MNVSVEISTYNRKDVLKMVLDRLCDQTYPTSDFEVVVSDDGSTDGLVESVRQWAVGYPYEVRILEHQRVGVGCVHNSGIRACRAPLVILLAADVLPESDFISQHCSSHREHPEPNVVIAGQLRQAPNIPHTVFQEAFDSLLQRLFDDQLKGLHVPNFWVSNMSFKKQFMLDYGMFHEWQYAAGEDIELGYRLKEHGMRLLKNPNAVGYHYHVVTPESIVMRSYSTGYYRYLLEQHVNDPDFWAKIGKPKQGGIGLLKSKVKGVIRNSVENKLVMKTVVLPLMNLAERVKSLAPLVPMLCQRMTSYYFAAGVRDYDRNVPFDPFRAKIYPTDPE